MNNNRIHPDPDANANANANANADAFWAERVRLLELRVTKDSIMYATEWVPGAIRTITLISEGRKLAYTTTEQCALVACGTACVALGFSLLCFGKVCRELGPSLCDVSREDATVRTNLGFRYTAVTKRIVQPVFDHFELRFAILMMTESPTRDEMLCRYKMVEWVMKTCTAMGFEVPSDLTPIQVIDFLQANGLI